MRKFFFIPTFIFSTLSMAQTPCPGFDAWGDTMMVCGDIVPVQLNATPGYDIYQWSPATGLSDPTISNPVAAVSGTTLYTVTASSASSNIIANGDFSMGNVGFTSGLAFIPFYSPGNYYVGDSFFDLTISYDIDHTPTSDNHFMSVDGINYLTTLWETTVSVLPNEDYKFDFWCIRADAVQPNIEIHFIGNVTGDVLLNTVPVIPYSGLWTWDQYGAPLWNSATNTSLTIRLINLELNTFGNDFALDDMTLIGPACGGVGHVTVAYDTYVTAPEAIDTVICLQPGIFIPTVTGNDLLWYELYPGTAHADAPVINTNEAGIHTFFVTQSLDTCESDPTPVVVEILTAPVFNLPDVIYGCENQTTSIGPPDNDVNTYIWSDEYTGTPRPVNVEETYILTATNQCGSLTDTTEFFLEECHCYFYVPNAVTPNGDGSNDVFRPVYDCILENYQLLIFNRWGEIVFETSEVNQAWNATYKNSGLVQDGVYTWAIRFDEILTGEIATHRGHVTVLR